MDGTGLFGYEGESVGGVIDGDGFWMEAQMDGFDDRRNLRNNTHSDAISAARK